MQGSPIPLRRPLGLDGPLHLVTGATGFVGAALVLELLQRTSDGVVALARAPGAEARFRDGLAHAARAYGVLLPREALDRCRVLVGDVQQPGCGIGPIDGEVDQVWHCAASLRYEDRYEADIRATNVGGTENVLALARRLGARCFNHVSTAYVAGRNEGEIAETSVSNTCANNAYERSKIEGERLVLAATGMQTRIFRPSVVVGHGRTLAATTFSGFYGFVRQLVQFRGMMERTQQGLLKRTPMRIRLDPDAEINLVPVDEVAAETVEIGLQPQSSGIFHLTHPSPPTVGEAVRTIFAIVGLHEPLFVQSASELGWLDAKFDERLDFYGSYIRGDKRFSRARTDAALGKPAPRPWSTERMAELGRWYLPILEQERRKLPVAR